MTVKDLMESLRKFIAKDASVADLTVEVFSNIEVETTQNYTATRVEVYPQEKVLMISI